MHLASEDNLYLHPELSLLSFNERVLKLAQSKDIPALERLRFLCIFSSNMDEFFEIRVSGLKARAQSGLATEGVDGISPQSAIDQINTKFHELVEQQYQLLNDEVMPELKEHGIEFLPKDRWSQAQAKWIKQYFKREVLPILTPIRLDPAHPFPLTINKGLGIVADLHDPERDEAHNIAVVPAPRALPRFVRLPPDLSIEEVDADDELDQADNDEIENAVGLNNEQSPRAEYEYVYLSSIIHAHIKHLFSNVKVLGCHQFRITRNSDLYVDLEEVEDLARTLEGELPSRLYGEAIRLEVSHHCPNRLIKFLQDRLQLDKNHVYKVKGPVNLNRLTGLPEMVDRPSLKYPTFTPSVPDYLSQQANMFDAIANGDILLHHPFQSFAPVIDLIKQASQDPDVLAIKQTLYRTGSDSVVIQHLAAAARAGKEVTAIVELMARFDEQNNLATAQNLQASGAHVVYGMVGKKTHAKMLLIVRRERGKLRRYVHLGTGNYHQGNTRVYTDYGLLTCNKAITEDVHELFMQLTSQGPNPELSKMHQSPLGIMEMVLSNIERETENARLGKPARIIAKMNGLSSPGVVDALYKASQAGVQIDLIVRGICCLRPGLEGVSDNIRVRSVIGRFLEHGRIYCFENAGEKEIYLSSADWMPRNLRNRIEHCAPIEDGLIKDQIFKDLESYLQDNSGAWEMQPDGSYLAPQRGKTEYSAQNQLLLEFAEVY